MRSGPALGFGGGPIGNLYGAVDDATAAATVDAAWDAGMRWFDTAPHYGLGLSERRLGAALAGRPRAGYTLSTKVGRLLVPNPAPTGSDLAAGGFAVPDDLARRWDFSADGVRRSLDASLARLGVDSVDVVFVHDPDDHLDQAATEAVPALVGLREQGVVRGVGVGMNSVAGPLRLVAETAIDTVLIAGRWTLLDRTAEPLLDACAERGVRVVVGAPYNSGLLARSRPVPADRFDYRRAGGDLLARATALAELCERYGVSLPAAALRFPFRHPAVTAVLVGVRTPDEARAAAERLATPVPDDLWEALDGR